jgi:hypothetical protein
MSAIAKTRTDSLSSERAGSVALRIAVLFRARRRRWTEGRSWRSEAANQIDVPTLFGTVRTEMHALRTEVRRQTALLQDRVAGVKEKRS